MKSINPTLSSEVAIELIELDIEELVLNGFPPGSRYEIADAVQCELERLLSARGFSAEDIGGQTTNDAGAFTVTPGARPEQIGAQVAQAIFGRLGIQDPVTTGSQGNARGQITQG